MGAADPITRTCPGFRLASGRTVGICIGCELRDRKSAEKPLMPAAKLGEHGVWTCVDRVAPSDMWALGAGKAQG